VTAPDFAREVNEAVRWDSRKTLADVWQEYTQIKLSTTTYCSLIAVAQWGARTALQYAAADVEPVRLDPSSAKHYVIVKGGWPECSCGENAAKPHASFLWLTEHIANVYRATR